MRASQFQNVTIENAIHNHMKETSKKYFKLLNSVVNENRKEIGGKFHAEM